MSKSFGGRAFLRGERGTTAAEFALILPGLILMTIGVINLAVLLWGVAGLQYATEDAARWCMINSCAEAATVSASDIHYVGPLGAPTFTAHTAATSCPGGEQVIGAANFTLITGVTSFNIPVNAVACHPLG